MVLDLMSIIIDLWHNITRAGIYRNEDNITTDHCEKSCAQMSDQATSLNPYWQCYILWLPNSSV